MRSALTIAQAPTFACEDQVSSTRYRGRSGHTAVCALSALSKHETSQVCNNHCSGTSRYRCKDCRRFHTLNPKPRGRSTALCQQAVTMAADGRGYRSIARALKVNHQTIANWAKAATTKAKLQG